MTHGVREEATPARSPAAKIDTLLVAVALAGSNVGMYLLTVIAARLLAPATFGELGSLLAVLVVGAVPSMALQTTAALRVATDDGDRGPLVTVGLTTSTVVAVLALACTPLLMLVLHLDRPWAVLCLALSLAPITLNGLWHGILQGTHRFRALAQLLGFEGAARVGGALVGLLVTRTPTGALAGTVLGALAVAFVGWLICGRPRPRRRERGQLREVLHASQALLALVLLVNLDLVLARHTLPADAVGEYAVGSVVTKIAYWLPCAIAVVMLPRLVSEEGRRRVIPRALAVCAALNALVVLGAALFGPLALGLIGGHKYAGSTLAIWPFALVGSLLSLVQILLYARIASADRRSTALTWLAVALEIVLVLTALHGSAAQVVTAAVVATGVLVCTGALVELRARRRSVTAAATPPSGAA